MKILFNFASRSRPDKFFRHLDNIHIHTRTEDFIILASLDEDDRAMCNNQIKERLLKYPQVYPIWGASESKVHAINRAMLQAPDNYEIVINTSDDMHFIEQGFDEIIYNDMKEHFPDGDGVLHYPDQNQAERCMTMSIMGKKYYDRDKYIYNPAYKSLWCDLEAQEVAERRGCYKFINKRLFNHNHPSFGQGHYDEQYRKTESMEVRNADEQVYRTRQMANFYISAK